MKAPIYSVRMHGSQRSRHLTGAERIVPAAELETVCTELLRRALEHERGRADAIRLSVDEIDPASVRRGRLPDVHTVLAVDVREGRREARRFLGRAGVAPEAVDCAVTALSAGAAPCGGNMRGAMILDADSGRRLEPDPARGVRASRMDLTPAARRRLVQELARVGLDNTHVREALVLAAKVLSAPGIIAELCWSDDPSYTAGYVAAPELGYVRFPHLKSRGDERGGRAFFWRAGSAPLDATIVFLEEAVLLIDEIGRIEPPLTGV
jgi:6-carboxyhexanoate--CoA ligase